MSDTILRPEDGARNQYDSCQMSKGCQGLFVLTISFLAWLRVVEKMLDYFCTGPQFYARQLSYAKPSCDQLISKYFSYSELFSVMHLFLFNSEYLVLASLHFYGGFYPISKFLRYLIFHLSEVLTQLHYKDVEKNGFT